MILIVTLKADVANEQQADNYLAALKQWLSDKPGIKGKSELKIDKSGELKTL
ncbi:hypothetical protein LCGC14_0872340 [marine sediment metagenome]|uniref:Uncharacterized protein n=1 Tax=marine sediment metagenome TaxID=412755 RepID=A0A0F9PPV7_9ZZZZ